MGNEGEIYEEIGKGGEYEVQMDEWCDIEG